MSTKTPVNCGNFPTLTQANLQQKVDQDAKRQHALRKGRKQSSAAAEARRLEAAKSAWKKSPDTSYAGAAKAILKEKPKAPAKAKPNASAKAPAPTPTKSTWTNVGGTKKSKAQAKGKSAPKRLPLPDYITSLKKQVNVLNQRKAKAEHNGKTKDAESFQHQINRLWGMMKRAEERLRQSGCRRWNNQHGGLRKKHTLGDIFARK
jgi:hypothetical protein